MPDWWDAKEPFKDMFTKVSVDLATVARSIIWNTQATAVKLCRKNERPY